MRLTQPLLVAIVRVDSELEPPHMELNGDLALVAYDFEVHPVVFDTANHAFQIGDR